MINKIEDLKAGIAEILPDTFERESLIENFRNTIKVLKSNLTLAVDVIEITKDNKIEDYVYLSTIAIYNNIKTETVAPILSYLLGILTTMDSNSRDIDKLLLDLPDVVIRENINLRSAMLYKIVSDFYFLNRFIVDLLNYTIDVHSNTKRYDAKDYDYRNISNSELAFIQIAKMYAEDDKFAKNFEKTYPDILIELNSKDSDSFLDTIIKKIKGPLSVVNSLSSGFKYNPFYVLGKMYVNYELKKARSLKDKQEMLKFKIIEAQTLNSEGKIDNEKMSRAIATYQKEIAQAEYEIDRILKD